MGLGSFLSSQWAMILAGVAGLATAAVALFWSKYPVRWLLAIATIGLGIFAYAYPLPGEIDELLPGLFREAPRLWFFALAVIALYSTAHLVSTVVRSRVDPTAAEGPFGDIQAAWREILIQLSQARIDPAAQDLYLLLGPDESLANSMVGAAGLQFFAKAPASVEAPIHCYAVADALFLSCAGASSMGHPGADGPARLEFLCRLIESLNPERPILRGIAVLIPFDWAGSRDTLRQVSAIRDDLQAIRQTLKVRCPTMTVFCLQEASILGFQDFAARLPAKLRHQRCGFSVPISHGTDAAVLRRGMIWMTRWFQVWSLNLMVAEIRDKEGNGRLLSMNLTLGASRDALVRILESGLTVHQQAEPVLYLGCYFAACGPPSGSEAFVAGLLNGSKKARLLADRELTTWSREADLLDRGLRIRALALGIATAAIALPIWYIGIISRLEPLGKEPIAWAALAALIVLWAGVLLLGRRSRRASPPRL